MKNKEKILILLLLISVVINVYNYLTIKNDQEIDGFMEFRAGQSVENAATFMNELVYNWDDLKDTEKIKITSGIKSELRLAKEALLSNHKYLYFISTYNTAISDLTEQIIKGDVDAKSVIDLKNDFNTLSQFIGDYSIFNESEEYIEKKWLEESTKINNKHILESFE